MSDIAVDGGAPASVDPTGAPITAPVEVPNPLGSQVPAVEKPEVKPEPAKTAGEAVQRAMEKVKAAEAAKAAPDPEKPAPGTEAKPAPTDAQQPKPQERAPDGKFTLRQPEAQQGQQQQPQPQQSAQQPAQQPAQQQGQQQGHHEAPQRFDAAAKAEWANAPESVKGAVHRAFREMEAGLEEHRQRWEPIKHYDDMAKHYGTDLPSALERYVSMDTLLSKDLAQGLDSIIRDKTGNQLGLREFIAHVTGQQPDQAQSQSDAVIHELRAELAELRKHLGGVASHIQNQSSRSIEAEVVAFSKDKPDFEALAPHMVPHIQAGKQVSEAYELARQEMAEVARSLGFVPANTQQQPLSPAPQPQPLKPAGQKSITGAPSTGSDPASMKKAPASSIREALERAKARVA